MSGGEDGAEELFFCTGRAEVAALAADWDRLAAAAPLYVPCSSDVDALFADPEASICLAGVRRSGVVTCLMLFTMQAGERAYWLGERKLFGLTLRTARLFGPGSLGTASSASVAGILTRIAAMGRVDLFDFDDLAATGPLYPAVVEGQVPGPGRTSHHNAARRLIDLPPDVAGYWAAVRPNTRRTGLRDQRYFERLAPEYRLYIGSDAITDFLPAAAALSARTYQSGFGLGLVDAPHLRALFARLAEENRLRCYLALVDGEPAAFAWGDVSHGTFYFRNTGYCPSMARHQAGKGILLHVIADLTDTGAARRFDFGVRDMEYKERFSTRTVEGAHATLGRWSRPKGLAAIAADRVLDAVKAAIKRGASPETTRLLRQRLRRFARPS